MVQRIFIVISVLSTLIFCISSDLPSQSTNPQQNIVKSNFCPSCGLKNDGNNNFCTGCGTKIIKSETTDSKIEISTEIIEKVKKSVVSISARFKNEYDGIHKKDIVHKGSGVLISSKGYIIKANHVVHLKEKKEKHIENIKKKKIKIKFSDGSEHTAKLIAKDRFTDLALVKISSPPPFVTDLAANNVELKVGDKVTALGSPLDLSETVTLGIISKLHRNLSYGGIQQFEDFIQIDTPINPGSSGGPLVNANGKIIGIINAGMPKSVAEGLGFAIPVWWIRRTMADLINGNTPNYAWLGLWATEIDGKVVVDCIMPDSPVKDKFHKGDVILAIDNVDITSISVAQMLVNKSEPEIQLNIKIQRNSKIVELEIVTEKRKNYISLPAIETFKLWGVTLKENINDNCVQIEELDNHNSFQRGIRVSGSGGLEKGDVFELIVPQTYADRYKYSATLDATNVSAQEKLRITNLASLEKLYSSCIEDGYLKMVLHIKRLEKYKQFTSKYFCEFYLKLPCNNFI